MLLILLVFCAMCFLCCVFVCLGGGVYVSHLVSFLCCFLFVFLRCGVGDLFCPSS